MYSFTCMHKRTCTCSCFIFYTLALRKLTCKVCLNISCISRKNTIYMNNLYSYLFCVHTLCTYIIFIQSMDSWIWFHRKTLFSRLYFIYISMRELISAHYIFNISKVSNIFKTTRSFRINFKVWIIIKMKWIYIIKVNTENIISIM